MKAYFCRLSRFFVPFSIFAFAISAHSALTNYDDFHSPSASNAKWQSYTSGSGTVTFSDGQAILSLSNNVAGGAAQLLASNFVFQISEPGDAVRATWDMQIVRGGSNAFQSGIYLGNADSGGLTAGQSGQQNGATNYWPFMQFFPHTSAQNIARGFDKYHYDLEGTLINVNGTLSALLNVYSNNPVHGADPASYRSDTPLQTTRFGATIITGTLCKMLFYLNDPYNTHGDCCGGDRGAIAVDNVFVEFKPGASRQVVPITNTSIFTAVELTFPTEWNGFYRIQWATNSQFPDWYDLGPLVVGSGLPASVFDSTRHQSQKIYRVHQIQ